MRPDEARALLVFQNKAEADKLSEALMNIGFKQIKILVEESPNAAYAAIIQAWDLDVVLTDTEFTSTAAAALAKLFPDILLLLLNSKPPLRKETIQRAVLQHIRGTHK